MTSFFQEKPDEDNSREEANDDQLIDMENEEPFIEDKTEKVRELSIFQQHA